MTKLTWTDELTELAIKMWTEGSSSAEIAAVIGTSRNSVIGKMHREQVAGRVPKHPTRTGEMPWNGIPVVEQAEKTINLGGPEAAPLSPGEARVARIEAKTVEATKGRGVLFMATVGMQCRWPLWGFNDTVDISEKYVCGEPTTSPSCSWCSEHFKIVSEERRERLR